jgi:TfoX/Sxy family transcriptional regulator of competence genes
MAYNEDIANRIASALIDKNIAFEEKKMFGGMAFMIQDKMCIGVVKDEIMLRVLDIHYDTLLEKEGFKPMLFTGKPMKGFLFIEEAAFKTIAGLNVLIDFAEEFGKLGVVKSKKK